METPGTSDGLKNLCVTANNLEENREQDEYSIVSILDQDAEMLLHIFPEEIWRKILGEVHLPGLESVNNASSFFRSLLYPERQIFLFSPVWKILGVQYEVDSDPVYCDLELPEDIDLNEARIENYHLLTHSVILKLRLVCRDWCLAINKFYEDLYHNYDTEDSVLKPRVESGLDSADEDAINRKYGRYNLIGKWSQYKFYENEMVEDFLEHFEATHGHASQTNPIPFRKVIFDSGILFGEEKLDYCSKVVQLLRKYGHHIWFCEFTLSHDECLDISDNYRWALELYLKIQEMLSLMPNLKALRFPLDDLTQMGDEETEQVRLAMVNHPIPKLENLRFVSFNSSMILVKHLLENNAQVNKIDIQRSYGRYYESLEELKIDGIPLPDLTKLAICFHDVGEFQIFENYGQLWRLKMFHITLSLGEFIPHPRIFKFLEQWKDSLTDVAISFPISEREEDKIEIMRNSGIRLGLPHVKRLALRMHHIMSMDLILPMRNTLELLEYSRWCPVATDWETIPKRHLDEMKTREVIQFYSVQNGDMYNSNIWTLFPNLRRIEVDDDGESEFRNGPAYIRQKTKPLEGQE